MNLISKIVIFVFVIGFSHSPLFGVEEAVTDIFEIPEDDEDIVADDIEYSKSDEKKEEITKSENDDTSSEGKNLDKQDDSTLEESVVVQYEEFPDHIYKNQIFKIKIKTVLASGEYQKIKYKLYESRGLQLINKDPERTEEEHYVFDTFYFKALEDKVVTPSLYVYIQDDEVKGYKTYIKGEKLDAMELIPPDNYSGVLASNLNLIDSKTTRYDQENNILIFSLEGYFSDLKLFNIRESNIKRQGFETIRLKNDSFLKSSVTYFVVIPKYLTQFSFSYFNTESETFKEINVPIIVSNDIVSTQTDLAPKENSHKQLKIIISALILVLAIFLYWFYRKSLFLFLGFMILPYLVFLVMPPKVVCVKENTLVRILPMMKSTVFQQLSYKSEFEKLGELNDFIKIKLLNNNVGWVREDDLCKK